MILVDTNIFLEVLLGRDKAGECMKYLGSLSDEEDSAVVTRFSLHAIEAIMGESGSILTSFLRTIDQTAGLIVYETSTSDEVAASLLSTTIKRDFDDALQYYAAKKAGATAIMTYDKHFEGLDLPRIEPGNA